MNSKYLSKKMSSLLTHSFLSYSANIVNVLLEGFATDFLLESAM